MLDLHKDLCRNVIYKLSEAKLPPQSYFALLIFMFSSYRFSFVFIKRFSELIDRMSALGTITPSPSGDEDERKKDEV